jgi:cyclic pyranopterin phosphate synthase
MYNSRNLEVHVVDHCNLDCVGCSHESPLMSRRIENPDRLSRALSELWKYYRAPLVKLLGGEPLLHPNIDAIIRVVKARTGARLRLVTNGTLLKRLHHRLHGIDEIHISSYPGATILTDREASIIAADLNAPITIQAFGNFRWARSLVRENAAITRRVFDTCQLFHSWQCHTLRDGWLYACPPAATWANCNGEGVNLLEPGPDFKSTLERLLTRQIPFESCKECLGSAGQLFKHSFGWHASRETRSVSTVDLRFLQSLELDPDAHNGCFKYERTILPSGKTVQLRGKNP